MIPTESSAPPRGDLGQIAVKGLLVAAALIALYHAACLLQTWRVLVAYPYGIDYGEGIVWQQMLNMLAGQGYAPLGVYPAIVYHYPPVYHVIVGVIARAFGTDPLATGRVVSAIATLASAAVIASLTACLLQGRATQRIRAFCGAAAALAFLATDPVVDWGALMRVDMLACALGLAGLWCAIRAADRPSLIHAASLCFVLATYTKQVAVAAPLAGIVGLAIGHRRLALICLAETAALGLVSLGALEIVTTGGFLRHVVLYNVNRVDWTLIGQLLLYPVKMHIVLIALAVFGVGDQLRWAGSSGGPAASVLLIFTAIKTVMLVMIVKSGANLNYTIEWFAMIAILAGAGLAPVLDYATSRATPPPEIVRLMLAGLLMLQVSWLPVKHATLEDARSETAARAPIISTIRHARRPVISDDMTFLLRGNQPVLWEPAIMAELAKFGRYDEAAFIRLIRAHHFAFFVTEGERGSRMFDARYNPAVSNAMDGAYPRKQQIAAYILHLPPLP